MPRPPTEGQVGEAWHRREAAPAETAAQATLRRIEARERFTVPRNAPAPVPPGEPSGRPGWLLLPSLGALAVVVTMAGLVIAGQRIAGGRHETVP